MKRAVVSGQIRPGDAFPSVRVLSRELKVNPNTAHKAISQLTVEGILEVKVGVGTVVADRLEATGAERSRLLEREVEQIVVEAKRLGLDLAEVLLAVKRHWNRLGNGRSGSL